MSSANKWEHAGPEKDPASILRKSRIFTLEGVVFDGIAFDIKSNVVGGSGLLDVGRIFHHLRAALAMREFTPAKINGRKYAVIFHPPEDKKVITD